MYEDGIRPKADRPTGSEAPSFSVITPTLNRVDRLGSALNSVAEQTLPPIEHIVVDGGSVDGTLDLLEKHPDVTVISEPDDGLYDAINKGIKASSGDVIVIVNDDDILLPDALAVASQAFVDDPRADMFCGQVIVGQSDTNLHDVLIGAARLQRLNPRAHAAGSNLVNARFFRRVVFERVGMFEPRYRISADTEFLARCYLTGARVVTRPVPVYRYGMHPGALTFHGGRASESIITERIRIALDHLPQATTRLQQRYWMRWMWWWTFYRLVRWRPAGGLRAMGRLFVRDPAGFVDFLAQSIWHIRTIRERRGRPVTDAGSANTPPSLSSAGR